MGIIGTFEGSANPVLWIKNEKSVYNGGMVTPIIVSEHTSKQYTYCYNGESYIQTDSTNYKNVSMDILGRFSSEIILTPYSNLHINVSVGTYGNANVSLMVGAGNPSMSNNSFAASASVSDGVSQTTYNINISGLSGKYCIFAFLYMYSVTNGATRKLYVNQIWMD